MPERFDLRACPLAYERPLYLTNVTSWHIHIPFAFAAVEMVRPRLFVELGTHQGDSYCAFCQAVAQLALDCACYAIDSWKGDVHTHGYDRSVLDALRQYHDPLYGKFSTLVPSLFDDALPKFREGSIDLLHIDGTHTYDAVRHDFERWLPKMSSYGIVLLHDIVEHKGDFGVWKLWKELKDRFPHFAFAFGHGLGVVAVGPEIPAGIKNFLIDQEHHVETSLLFAGLGAQLLTPDAPLDLSHLAGDRIGSVIASRNANKQGHGLGDADPHLIAFYFPQFHPTLENDVWWGKGFTEWTNVVRARPLFPGHEQPHLPADLGFYDLRLAETREAQAELARRSGIAGFCYYHYWFHGRRLLERPFDDVLSSGSPDFPFCLLWINENWKRSRDSGEQECLIPQTSDSEDDFQHVAWLVRVFGDRRYIRLRDRPLLLIYRVENHPDIGSFIDRLRAASAAAGLQAPYVCCLETRVPPIHPRDAHCDATIESLPHHLNEFASAAQHRGDSDGPYRVYAYQELVQRHSALTQPGYRRFSCVLPGWDTTPRFPNGDATIVQGASPELYERWLATTVGKAMENPEGERLVFINAWNEWANGAYLEPDLHHGHAYLDATRRVLCGAGVDVDGRARFNADSGDRTTSLYQSRPEERYRQLQERFTALQVQFTKYLGSVGRTPLHSSLLRQLNEAKALLDERTRWARELHENVRLKDHYIGNLEAELQRQHTERAQEATVVERILLEKDAYTRSLQTEVQRQHDERVAEQDAVQHMLAAKDSYAHSLEAELRRLRDERVAGLPGVIRAFRPILRCWARDLVVRLRRVARFTRLKW